MISDIAFYPIFGLPMVAVGGIVLFLVLVLTAAIGWMNKQGIHTIPVVWHYRLAGLTILLSVIHGILGIAMIMGF